MNYELGYQINVSGKSDGLTIPSGFAIVVKNSSQVSNNNGEEDPFSLEVQMETYKTTSFATKIKVNDDLMGHGFTNNGTYKSYGLTSANINTGLRGLLRTKIRADLNEIYGAQNVSEIV